MSSNAGAGWRPGILIGFAASSAPAMHPLAAMSNQTRQNV
jgi:hypothetical protein